MSLASREPARRARGDRSGARPIQDPGTPSTTYEGRVLGGFYLARKIASGGMAAVYLAHRIQHARIGQMAAVKVIHPHLARDEDFVEMFLDEARIASCITHPNVCRPLDFGMSEGTYYLAMEYVVGETLADVLTRLSTAKEDEAISVALLSQVATQVCEGLHAAHEGRDPHGTPLNIVHRDISPQNIMVGYDGSVRVLDFGIASASERLHSTRNGKIKGRLAYMAPEQMRGLPTDRRADLWSLGVVLWEGLAGRRLFKHEDEVKTIVAVTYDHLPSLADCGRRVPISLQRIVARTLTRDRESRYATAREVGLALSGSATRLVPCAGVPELSVWMQSQFADCIERKRALLRDAADAAESSAGIAAFMPGAGIGAYRWTSKYLAAAARAPADRRGRLQPSSSANADHRATDERAPRAIGRGSPQRRICTCRPACRSKLPPIRFLHPAATTPARRDHHPCHEWVGRRVPRHAQARPNPAARLVADGRSLSALCPVRPRPELRAPGRREPRKRHAAQRRPRQKPRLALTSERLALTSERWAVLERPYHQVRGGLAIQGR